MKISNEHIEILKHTIKNELFCGSSSQMDELCEAGLMELVGKKSFVPDPYYRVTEEGKKAVDSRGEEND